MRACRPTGGAHVADDLALRDGFSGRDDIMGHVSIQAGIAVTVVDGNIVAVNIAVCSRRDRPAPGGVNRRSCTGSQIHAGMEAPLTGHRVHTIAICVGDRDPVREGILPPGRGGVAAAAAAASIAVATAAVAVILFPLAGFAPLPVFSVLPPAAFWPLPPLPAHLCTLFLSGRFRRSALPPGPHKSRTALPSLQHRR